jgi:cytochrome c2
VTPRYGRWLTGAYACLLLAGCSDEPAHALGGDPDNGRALLRQFGCGSCHRLPGVRGASGNVGPSLEGIGRRVYLAGVVANSPQNMARWIRDPQAFDPDTAMPNLQLSETQARDMVAYLQELK